MFNQIIAQRFGFLFQATQAVHLGLSLIDRQAQEHELLAIFQQVVDHAH